MYKKNQLQNSNNKNSVQKSCHHCQNRHMKGGKKGQFKILNVLIVFVTFGFLHFSIPNYGQILYLYNKWNFVVFKNPYFKKLFYLTKANLLYLEKPFAFINQ